jgi:hypothetical protein
MSSGGCLPDPNWCQTHHFYCGHYTPKEKWDHICALVAGSTITECYKIFPRFRSCRFRGTYADAQIHVRCIKLFVLAREKKRIFRQITQTANTLSRILPPEILNPLAQMMVRNIRPLFATEEEALLVNQKVFPPQKSVPLLFALDKGAFARVIWQKLERKAQKARFRRML